MALEAIIGHLQATLETEKQRRRYLAEEKRAERIRRDLATCNREQWLQDTLDTDEYTKEGTLWATLS